jgi:hypothetical protein
MRVQSPSHVLFQSPDHSRSFPFQGALFNKGSGSASEAQGADQSNKKTKTTRAKQGADKHGDKYKVNHSKIDTPNEDDTKRS